MELEMKIYIKIDMDMQIYIDFMNKYACTFIKIVAKQHLFFTFLILHPAAWTHVPKGMDGNFSY